MSQTTFQEKVSAGFEEIIVVKSVLLLISYIYSYHDELARSYMKFMNIKAESTCFYCPLDSVMLTEINIIKYLMDDKVWLISLKKIANPST
jgi:hypothetical protein